MEDTGPSWVCSATVCKWSERLGGPPGKEGQGPVRTWKIPRKGRWQSKREGLCPKPPLRRDAGSSFQRCCLGPPPHIQEREARAQLGGQTPPSPRAVRGVSRAGALAPAAPGEWAPSPQQPRLSALWAFLAAAGPTQAEVMRIMSQISLQQCQAQEGTQTASMHSLGWASDTRELQPLSSLAHSRSFLWPAPGFSHQPLSLSCPLPQAIT